MIRSGSSGESRIFTFLKKPNEESMKFTAYLSIKPVPHKDKLAS